MNFRQAVLKAADSNPKVTPSQKKKIKAANDDRADHPRLWKAAENFSVHRYERKTGKKFDGDYGGPFLDWLVTNLPKLLEFLPCLLA